MCMYLCMRVYKRVCLCLRAHARVCGCASRVCERKPGVAPSTRRSPCPSLDYASASSGPSRPQNSNWPNRRFDARNASDTGGVPLMSQVRDQGPCLACTSFALVSWHVQLLLSLSSQHSGGKSVRLAGERGGDEYEVDFEVGICMAVPRAIATLPLADVVSN